MRPATKLDMDNERPIYHTRCKRVVYRESHWDGHHVWRCAGCSRAWSRETMRRWDDVEFGFRFYVEALRFAGDWVLVEKTEGSDRFTTLVPAHQAHQYDKVKL